MRSGTTDSRSEKRYIVFQVLPDTLDLGPEVWRVLSKCHDMRNRTEYEGVLDVDDRLDSDRISACRRSPKTSCNCCGSRRGHSRLIISFTKSNLLGPRRRSRRETEAENEDGFKPQARGLHNIDLRVGRHDCGRDRTMHDDRHRRGTCSSSRSTASQPSTPECELLAGRV